MTILNFVYILLWQNTKKKTTVKSNINFSHTVFNLPLAASILAKAKPLLKRTLVIGVLESRTRFLDASRCPQQAWAKDVLALWVFTLS